jgi:hypothetical protein
MAIDVFDIVMNWRTFVTNTLGLRRHRGVGAQTKGSRRLCCEFGGVCMLRAQLGRETRRRVWVALAGGAVAWCYTTSSRAIHAPLLYIDHASPSRPTLVLFVGYFWDTSDNFHVFATVPCFAGDLSAHPCPPPLLERLFDRACRNRPGGPPSEQPIQFRDFNTANSFAVLAPLDYAYVDGGMVGEPESIDDDAYGLKCRMVYNA